jgi:hypothetical protein
MVFEFTFYTDPVLNVEMEVEHKRLNVFYNNYASTL